MKLGTPYTEPNFPAWAIPYLVNGDATGFDHNPDTAEQDKKLVDAWADANPGIHEYTNEEPHFSWHPAFGLACDCIELTIYPMEETA